MPFLLWLDADRNRYLAFIYAPLYSVAALALAPFVWPAADRRLNSRWGTVAFFALVALALFAGRWRALFLRESLDIDEAGMLALANQMVHFPIPWVDYDPQTVGPLNAIVLDIPRLIGITPGWISMRLVGLGITFLAIVALYATIALLFEARVARLAVVPALLFFTTVHDRNFLHYSTELVSMALTIWATFLLLLAARRRLSPWPVAGCALIGGAIPFAKLQAAPIAVSIVVLLALTIAGSLTIPWRVRLNRLLLALAMAAAVPAIILLPVAAHGALRDFWISYILSGFNYIWNDYLPPTLVLGTPEFSPFFDASALIALQGVTLIVLFWRQLGSVQRLAPFVLSSMLAASLYAIYAPKHGSWHYDLFAVFPIAACAGFVLGLAVQLAGQIDDRRRRKLVQGMLAAGFLIAACIAMPWSPRVTPAVGWVQREIDRPLDPIAAAIDLWVGKGKRVAIWGWAPNSWVDSETLMGTRDLLTQHHIDPGPYRNYFRQRYVRDFLAIRPVGFLDAVAPDSFGYKDQKTNGFETFPELAAVIRRDYKQVATIGNRAIDGKPVGVRLFVRRDVLPHEESRSAILAEVISPQNRERLLGRVRENNNLPITDRLLFARAMAGIFFGDADDGKTVARVIAERRALERTAVPVRPQQTRNAKAPKGGKMGEDFGTFSPRSGSHR